MKFCTGHNSSLPLSINTITETYILRVSNKFITHILIIFIIQHNSLYTNQLIHLKVFVTIRNLHISVLHTFIKHLERK